MQRFKSALITLLKGTVSYVVFVAGSVFLLLVVSSVVGYLPYSDRPGPGWYGWLRTAPDLQALKFFLGFVLLLMPICALFGFFLFLAAEILYWFRAPFWLVAVVSAPVTGYATAYIVAAIGWYIAIAAFPVYGAGVLGLLFGGLLLPRLSQPKPAERSHQNA